MTSLANLSQSVQIDPKLASSGALIIPRIDVMQATSKAVKEKKLTFGVFAKVVNKTEYVDLGEAFVGLICGLRFKAMCFNPLTINYDASSEISQEIVEKCDGGDGSYIYGYELLIYNTETQEFLTFHLKGKSLSREAEVASNIYSSQVEAQAWQPVTLRTKEVSNHQGSWYTANFDKFNNDPENLPEQDELDRYAQEFFNAKPLNPSSDTEPAADARV